MLGDTIGKFLRGKPVTENEIQDVERLLNETQYRNSVVSGLVNGDGSLATQIPIVRIYSEMLSENTASIEVPVSGAYKHLLIVGSGRTTEAAYYSAVGARFNGDSGANYRYQYDGGGNATQATAQGTGATYMIIGSMAGASADANAVGCLFAILPNSFGALYKSSISVAGAHQGAAADMLVSSLVGFYQSTNPVASMTILPGSGSFVAGTAISVYGLS